jgi:hypothetical protein
MKLEEFEVVASSVANSNIDNASRCVTGGTESNEEASP